MKFTKAYASQTEKEISKSLNQVVFYDRITTEVSGSTRDLYMKCFNCNKKGYRNRKLTGKSDDKGEK